MLLPILLILVAALTVASYLAHDKQLVAPGVLFPAGFTLSLAFATLYQGAWQLELHLNTFFALLLGIAWFCLICVGFHHYFVYTRSYVYDKPSENMSDKNDAPSHLRSGNNTAFVPNSSSRSRGFVAKLSGRRPKTWLAPVRPYPLLVFAAIQLVVFVVTLIAIQDLFPNETLAAAIKSYNSTNTFTTDGPALPRVLDRARMLCTGGTYLIAYLIGQEIARGWRKGDEPLVACAVLGTALILETGGRTSAIAYIVVAVIAYFVTFKRLNPERSGVPGRAIAILAAIIIAVLVLFKFASVGGRGAEDRDILEYLAMYLGAEIFNLDTFLQGYDGTPPDLLGYMTFMRDWNYFGGKLGIDAWVYAPDLPFRYSGEYSLGNVATIFYAFIYDFSGFGVFFLTAIMAAVSQLVYEKAALWTPTRWTTIWITVYAMLGFALVMSFFSNKFYEDILSINFVRNLLYVLIARYLLSYFAGPVFETVEVSDRELLETKF